MPRLVWTGLLAIALAVTGCAHHDSGGSAPSQSSSAAEEGGRGSIADLQVTDAYIPEPASPEVAAAYFAIRNNGDQADRLTSVTTPIASMSMLHRYVAVGKGAEEMKPLPSLTIPAHKTVRLVSGKTHLMIENPRKTLHQGQSVELTLTFAHAGRLTLTVPVVSIRGLGH